MKKRRIALLAGIVSALASPVAAAELPHVFAAGTPARAAEVNANFSAVAAMVRDLTTRIEHLEADNGALKTRLLELETNPVQALADLADVVEVSSDGRGPLVRFVGTNVQIVNGDGPMSSQILGPGMPQQPPESNGLGNLIIGYDERRPSAVTFLGVPEPECSIGGHKDRAACEGGEGSWALNHKTGSHNLVIGREHNYSRRGGLVAGVRNSITGFETVILGGSNNRAAGSQSAILGGIRKVTEDPNETIPAAP